MVDVPTMGDFNALKATVEGLQAAQLDTDQRLDALEEGGVNPNPPDPPDPPDPTTGVKAKRIADAIERFGVNTFSSLDPNANLWGSWPADYSPASVLDALEFCFPMACGFTPRIREYHYGSREDMQTEWIKQLLAQRAMLTFSICPGANAGVGDTTSMLSMASNADLNIEWLEGLNEPNTDFGSGMVPVDQTMAIQSALAAGSVTQSIMGPSVVAGTPHPEGWITGYFGDQMDAVNALMDHGNGHFYPPGCPDVPNTGYSTNEYIGGLWTAYGQHAIELTEFHPTLYNSEGNKPNQKSWSGTRDAYYTLMTLFRCAKNGTLSLYWYALFDYGSTYKCGIFPTRHADKPRPVANALRNLCTVCADPSNNAGTFETDVLDVSVTGGDVNTDWDLYQASDRRFLLTIWRAAKDPGGATIPVTLIFGSQVSINDHDVLNNTSQTRNNVSSYDMSIDAGFRVIEIT